MLYNVKKKRKEDVRGKGKTKWCFGTGVKKKIREDYEEKQKKNIGENGSCIDIAWNRVVSVFVMHT